MHLDVATCYHLVVLGGMKSCEDSAGTSGGSRSGDPRSAGGRPAQMAMPRGTYRTWGAPHEGEVALVLRGMLLRGHQRDLRQQVRGRMTGLVNIHLESDILEFEFLLLQ